MVPASSRKDGPTELLMAKRRSDDDSPWKEIIFGYELWVDEIKLRFPINLKNLNTP